MAIDTAIKRASALSVDMVSLSLVVPSGSITAGDRQTIGNTYSGILATELLLWTVQPNESTSWAEQANEATTWTVQ